MTGLSPSLEQLLVQQVCLVQEEFPTWRFVWESKDQAFFVGKVSTEKGADRYELRLYVSPVVPEACPALFVWDPVKLPRNPGGTINELDADYFQHTHPNGPDGRVRICWIHQREWDPLITYARAIACGYLWCQAYECHLEHGHPIRRYLC